MDNKKKEVPSIGPDYLDAVSADETAKIIEGIRNGLESMEKGEEQPAHDVFAELEAQFPFLRRQ